jgi:predicted AAA+ superfamily ATPase
VTHFVKGLRVFVRRPLTPSCVRVGKTTLLRQLDSIARIDLLDPDEQMSYNKNPNQLRELLAATPGKGTVIIDEIQRAPRLLDVVQSLLDRDSSLRFIMSGSSARKLRKGHANLLGGRVRSVNLHPLTASELDEAFHLEQVLAFGTLPHVCVELSKSKKDEARALLRAYVTTYLREEIKAEALVRTLHSFQNFLDVAAAQFAEQVNFSSVGRECQVAYTTVREYYSILEDTLIGFFLWSYSRSQRKRVSSAPKFYFFDNGVTRALLGTLQDAPEAILRGRLYEQWFIQEVVRLMDYHEKEWRLSFWRTGHGAEVDLLVEHAGKILAAFECKSSSQVAARDLAGLKSFHDDHPKTPLYVVAPVKAQRKIGEVRIMPPIDALKMLDAL